MKPPASHGPTSGAELHRPAETDLSEVHELYRDPRVWTHLPSGRHVDAAQTRRLLDGWRRSWEEHGLGQWIVRDAGSGMLLGHGGCAVRGELLWNLGYRFAVEAQGRGLGSWVGRCGLEAAVEVDASRAAAAYLLEHNGASAWVAEKLGLSLQHRGPDAGNPDPEAVRLVYADRTLNAEQLAAAMR
ncbi:hypothetical protein GCM10027060_12140 [Nesterenkonia halophila]|uniref:GNAT family N-acetyltransferase n=1 Tax=Nesterenkonia halophila TaxID=302044 RepID=UPI0012921B52|nr:GNAT family N-acetyltransferase [Nesterenkonia halophila]